MRVYKYPFSPRFADTDAASIVHFSKVFCYVEEAEHNYLQSLGFPINPASPKCYQWPRVSCSSEYLRPIVAFHPLHVVLTVSRLGKTSIIWYWEIQGEKHTYARGELKTVCCKITDNQMMSCEIPEDLRKTLSE